MLLSGRMQLDYFADGERAAGRASSARASRSTSRPGCATA